MDEPIGTVKPVRSVIFEVDTPHIKTRYYCLECGKQDVWVELDSSTGGGDYYHDHTGQCLSCDSRPCCLTDMPKPL